MKNSRSLTHSMRVGKKLTTKLHEIRFATQSKRARSKVARMSSSRPSKRTSSSQLSLNAVLSFSGTRPSPILGRIKTRGSSRRNSPNFAAYLRTLPAPNLSTCSLSRVWESLNASHTVTRPCSRFRIQGSGIGARTSISGA